MSERAIVNVYADGACMAVTAKQARTLVALGLCIPHPGVGEDGIEAGDLRLADGAGWPDVHDAVEQMGNEPADAWSAASHGHAASTAISERGVAELLDEFAKHDPHVALWASVPDASEADELVMDTIACEAMSDRFATFARERSYDPMLVTLDGADDPLVWTHTIVRLSGGCYVDWTARQYHNADVPLDRLPCPLVLVDPFTHPVGFTTATLYEPSSQRA